MPFIVGYSEVLAVLIASLPMSSVILAAARDGLLFKVISSASSIVLGNCSNTDLIRDRLFKFSGKD